MNLQAPIMTDGQRLMQANLASIYSSVYLVDLETKRYEVIKTVKPILDYYKTSEN